MKFALFTDVHFGKKNNSAVHNQDCVDFISWFANEVKKDGDVEAIGFLGDWYESRSAINISTLDYSYKGAKIIDDLCSELKIPCYFIVGNHDLHRRTTRDVHADRLRYRRTRRGSRSRWLARRGRDVR